MSHPNPPPHSISQPTVPRRALWRIWLARAIAVAADVIQLALIPLYPAAYVAGDIIDVVVAAVLTLLVGWHIAFVPSFIIKLLPIADLAPTWTVAIVIATWPGKSAAK